MSCPYSKTGEVDLLLVISDDPDNLDMYYEIWSGGRTIITLFVDVVRRIIDDIDPGTPSRQHFFTFYNVSSHSYPRVFAIIYEDEHRVIPQA